MKKSLCFFIFFLVYLNIHYSNAAKIDYRQRMRDLVILISKRAKNYKSNFYVIPQNALEIIDTSSGPSREYLRAIDGIGCEELLYGNSKDGVRTSYQTNQYFLKYLKKYKQADKKVLVIDYVKTYRQALDSYEYSRKYGFIAFPAERALKKIPKWNFSENRESVKDLQDVKNFLYQLTTPSYYSKKRFINSLKETNYDMLIIDAFFHGRILSKKDLEILKKKKSGRNRLAIAYLSIGEAETYRYYWKREWKKHKPQFLERENPQWKENYKVKYWMDDWQKIICGDKNGNGFASSYLKKILDAGFDGVYLDIVDAAFYFEKRK